MSEQRELRVLIDRAMDHLPEPSRRLLAERYELDLTMAELAQRRDISPATVAVQLQRARARLRTILLESFPDEAASFTPDRRPASEDWHRTRLWCPICGVERLRARLKPHAGDFTLQCPRCAINPATYVYDWRERETGDDGVLKPVRSAPQALDRTLATGPHYLAVERPEQRPRCPHCVGETFPKLVPIWQDRDADDDPTNISIEVWCERCGYLSASATLGGLAVFSEAGRAFWRRHGRILVRTVQRTTFGESDAVAVTLASISTSETLTSVFSADQALRLHVDSIA